MMNVRRINLIGFVIAIALLSYAVYMQFVEHVEPCALCIMQRLSILLLAILFLIALIHNPRKTGRRIYGSLQIIIAIAGAGFAARQLYLQMLPPDPINACLPGISYMFAHMPLSDTLHALLTGTGECAIVSWRFLGLSTPVWTLLFFALFAVIGVITMLSSRQA